MSALNAKIILIANLKGGSGKSTIAANMAVGLQKEGKDVFCIDIDSPQYSLSNYLNNRPDHLTHIEHTTLDTNLTQSEQIATLLEEKSKYYDFIIIDTPGNLNALNQSLYVHADVLLMPLNDSLMDLDLIMKVMSADSSANVDGVSKVSSNTSSTLGAYGQFIWDLKKQKAMSGIDKKLEWFVLRTRMAALFNKNKQRMENELKKLSKLLGFKLLPGILERVVYKNFFDQGITVFDLDLRSLTPSQAMARQEMRVLVHAVLDE